MKPIYIDLHIHTSDNPNNLNENYDVKKVLEKINIVAQGSDFLISLTDHNTINSSAYMALSKLTGNLLLGAELHIRNYENRPPYHCHIFFDLKINDNNISAVNKILDELYPEKVIDDVANAPMLEEIIRRFEEYDYLLLPHGGQSHSTFDKSVDRTCYFDTALQRNIYYNQFDGFTARDNNGLEETIEYFQRLGISEFVNLITCTDNYNPEKYPSAKSDEAAEFLPTWMLAKPTFNGLRLSLSESSRLIYSKERPQEWEESIKKVCCCNDKLDIDVELSAGLNVVIGGSSSGKTLFVDSVYRKICGDFNETDYANYNIEEINVENLAGCTPYYLSQNYIMKVVDKRDKENSIEDIEIIGKLFPGDTSVDNRIRECLARIKKDIGELICAVKTVDNIEKEISHIPKIYMLLIDNSVRKNIISSIKPSDEEINSINFEQSEFIRQVKSLDEIQSTINNNPFVTNCDNEFKIIKQKLTEIYAISQFESNLRSIVEQCSKNLEVYLASVNQGKEARRQNHELLLKDIRKYSEALFKFDEILLSIYSYSEVFATQEIESMGHKLFIENNFTMTKEKFIEIINAFLKSDKQIHDISEMTPGALFEENFKKQLPKVKDYEDFESKIYNEFEKINCKKYRIITSDGRDFDKLSAGWKTSILLDLILGYTGDNAPLIIDQPEDNLATGYINSGLITALKNIKARKQVILVSHNATIPMLGDAQNIVLCRNNGKILIRSAELEGKIEGKNVVDYIAEITDGGKSAIKKRVKKYNLKKFKE